jgi:thiamine pyrophosphate-dependent acetolactate synthase large subunit-like protein
MKVYEAIARALIDNGVDTMFGLIGDANMYFVSEFERRSEENRYVGAVDEGAACLMAHGYARVSGRVGVASVTHGPAASNTVTAVVEAVRAHSPVLLIVGDTPSKRDHIQHIDLHGVFSATGAEYRRVLSPKHVVDDIARLLAQVSATNRPVVLDIPFDIHHAEIEYEPAVFAQRDRQSVAPDPDAIDEALGRIASANRPLILAGRGAVEAGAKQTLEVLADLVGAPLATTASAKDLFQGHPYNLGICGASGTAWATDIIAKSDCVAVFGAGLNYYTTADGDLLRGKSVIHCDVDPSAIGRLFPASVSVIGDARKSAQAMVDQLVEAAISPTTFRSSQLGDGVLSRSPREDFVDQSDESTLDMRTAMVTLDEILPENRIVVTDGGRFTSAPWQYLHAPNARQFIHTFAFGSIGLGIPTAVGAAVAEPTVPTVVVTGDGGGMMNLIEFSTAVREGLPFLLVVLNDGAYGAEYAKLDRAGFGGSASFMRWPEFSAIGVALGGNGFAVRSEQELRDAIAATDLSAQTIIDVKANPHVSFGEI